MQRAEAMGNSERGAMRAAFLAFVVLAAVIWVGIAIGANARTPGAVGLAATVFGGLFASILTVAIGGGIALKLGAAETTQPPEQRAIQRRPQQRNSQWRRHRRHTRRSTRWWIFQRQSTDQHASFRQGA